MQDAQFVRHSMPALGGDVRLVQLVVGSRYSLSEFNAIRPAQQPRGRFPRQLPLKPHPEPRDNPNGLRH